MMKKIICLIMVFILLLPTIVFSYDEPISVTLDGEKLAFDVEPALIDGRTMVPIRAIFEAMGAVVEWDNNTQSAICTKGDTVVKMTIDSPTIYINERASQMDTSPVIINGRTLAPARFVAESFGYKVEWDNENAIAKITSVVSESEQKPQTKKDIAIDILDKSEGSFYTPYQSGLPELGVKSSRGISFQPDSESEEILLDLESKASFMRNETYCNLNGDLTEDYNSDYLWLTGTITVEVRRTAGDDFIVGDLINIDNFYWEDGLKINTLYSEFVDGTVRSIKNFNDIYKNQETDMSKVIVKSGEEVEINYKMLTTYKEKGYPVLRIIYDEGNQAKYMHLLMGTPMNYKNKEYLKPKIQTSELKLTKEECDVIIKEIENKISVKKEELNVAFSECNENKATDIQNKIKALELELEKYEAHLKSFE